MYLASIAHIYVGGGVAHTLVEVNRKHVGVSLLLDGS